MKAIVRRSFLLTGILMLPLFLFSQGGILSLSIIPANPNPEDSVSVIAEVWLPSGSCWLDSHSGFISQDTLVEINGTFNSGALTVICNTSDTFRLGRLGSGNYQVTYYMHYMNIPSIVDTGVLTFSVSGGTTSVAEVSQDRQPMTVVADPYARQVLLNYRLNAGETARVIRVYALDGRMLQTFFPENPGSASINLAMPGCGGLYLYTLETSENRRYSCKLAIP